MLRNRFSGNGYVAAGPVPNFGIGILVGAENLIEDNIVTGNLTGLRLNATATSNVIRGNTIAGNPPILVANNAPENAAFGFDILNLSSAEANAFENNLCITAMNAPCANLKPTADVIPVVTSIVFDPARLATRGSFKATFSGSNLTSATYFDIRVRAPRASSDEVVLNWQQGPSASHTVPQGTARGDWTVSGARAHLDANDHSGPLAPVQATLFVFVSPF